MINNPKGTPSNQARTYFAIDAFLPVIVRTLIIALLFINIKKYTNKFNVSYNAIITIRECNYKECIFMLYYALVFLIIAIIAGALGFGGVAAVSAGIAKIFFVLFLFIFLLLLLGVGMAVD